MQVSVEELKKRLQNKTNEIDRARNSILEFTKYTKKDYMSGEFHKAVSRKLDNFIFGNCNKMMLFAPP